MPNFRARLSLAAVAVLVACDVPTAAPIYDTLWNLPGKSTSISVNSLLPSGVQIAQGNSAFQVAVTPTTSTIARQLGQDCSACVVSHGQTTSKPAFIGGGTSSIAFPATVGSATLVRDTMNVSIANAFNFDPIRPSATVRGYLLITVKNGSTIVGRDSIDGSSTALPAGSTTARKIPLAGTIVGASGLQIVTTLNSPVGDPVAIDMTRLLTVTGGVGTFFVSSAQVSVANQSVTTTPTELDLSGIDSSITDRANGGSLVLTIVNPLNVTGNLAINFGGASTPLTKSVPLAAGTSTPSVTFTKSELNALFGRKLMIGYSGTLSGSNVTVAPGLVVSVSSRLQVAIAMGGK
jgi:hypothetical protein